MFHPRIPQSRVFYKHFIFIFLAAGVFTGCSVDRLDKNDTSEVMAREYELVRSFQRIQRYDCNGSLLSDRIETVSAPTRLVEIVPDTERDLVSSSFVNLTTGSNANCIVGHTKFQIDYAAGWCNMQVTEGINKIQYSFSYCSVWETRIGADGSSQRVCASSPVLGETGTLYIRIRYREVSLQGAQSVRPTADICQTSAMGWR